MPSFKYHYNSSSLGKANALLTFQRNVFHKLVNYIAQDLDSWLAATH
jgi:hypothetical protein